MKSKKLAFINFCTFYLSWWIIVLSMSRDLYFVPAIIFLIALFIHFKYVSEDFVCDLKEMAAISLLIIFVDSILYYFKIVFFYNSLLSFFSPVWLILMVIIFSTTIGYSFSGIKNKLWLQIICGGLFGPVTYLTAEKYNLIEVSGPFTLYYSIHVICWMFILPACFYISKKIRGNYL